MHENQDHRHHSPPLPGMAGTDEPTDPAVELRTRTWIPSHSDRGGTAVPLKERVRAAVDNVRARLDVDGLRRRARGAVARVRARIPRNLEYKLRRHRKAIIGGGLAVVALLLFFAIGGDGADSGVTAEDGERGKRAGAASVIESAGEETMCGSDDAAPPRWVSDDDWGDYSCQPRRAASRWSKCLKRTQYTRSRGSGCPGAQRCCPDS